MSSRIVHGKKVMMSNRNFTILVKIIKCTSHIKGNIYSLKEAETPIMISLMAMQLLLSRLPLYTYS